jgi:hypothetical protein
VKHNRAASFGRRRVASGGFRDVFSLTCVVVYFTHAISPAAIEHQPENPLYGVVLQSTVASGRISRLSAEKALQDVRWHNVLHRSP